MVTVTSVIILAASRLHGAAWHALIAAQPGLGVSCTLAHPVERDICTATRQPAAVLVDVPGQHHTHVQQCRALSPELGILVLVAAYKLDEIVALIQSGATGCLAYDAAVADLARALIAVSRGELVVPADLAVNVLARLARRVPAAGRPVERLSERELDVLRLLAQGYTNKDIAQTLVLSVRTVEAHLRTIFGKIGVRSRTDAALWAHRHCYGGA
ncbi:MAG: response regulator transcription factor [Chloroflexota bacterium]|nr:response regulator transcription factor [Chloroflexota bacterium]